MAASPFPSLHNRKAPSRADREIGARIRLRRITIGLSQERLGARIGVTFQQIQKYEKGANRIGAGRLQAIAAALGVPVGSLYAEAPGRDGEPKLKDGIPGNGLAVLLDTPHGRRLLRAFDAIRDARLRRKAVELVEAIAKVEA
jgi:transcriptional regulator with XRE-family HTH domain